MFPAYSNKLYQTTKKTLPRRISQSPKSSYCLSRSTLPSKQFTANNGTSISADKTENGQLALLRIEHH